MSEYLIQEETLRGIADSIRAKTGKTDPMGAEQMAAEIDSISAGGGGGDIDGLIDGSLTEVTSNATSVRGYAFYKCTALTSANIPNATSVGDYAFYQCSKLTSANFPNVATVGESAFYKCSSLTSADFPKATSVGGGAFFQCSLTSANFPNATSMNSAAFRYCHFLTSADFPNVTSAGNNTFYGCSALISADFHSATSVGDYAFYECYALTSAYFPNATSVKQAVFYACRRITKLILGTKQTTVATLANTNAFSGCYHILGTVDATYNPDGLKDGYIYVPASLVADYRVATNWATYATQIMPWVATVEELANIDGTTYDHACVGEGVDSVEYAYNGTSWEVFR